MAAIGTLVVAGCTGSNTTGASRAGLSNQDEQGLQKYEEGYKLSQEALSDYEAGWQTYIENVPEDSNFIEGNYPGDWPDLSDRMRGVEKTFRQASTLFDEARELSESPEFNEPCVRAVQWIQAHLEVLDWFGEAGGPPRSRAVQLHNEAKRTDSPLPPDVLLDRILGRPTGSYTPLGGQQTPMQTKTATETPAETPTSDLVIEEEEFVVDESGDQPAPYVTATIVNRGDGASGPVQLVVRWYDADGNFLYEDDGRPALESQSELISLDAGETWRPRVYAINERSEIADAEIEVDAEGEPLSPEDNVEVLGSELQVNGTTVTITGQVRNTSGKELLSVSVYSKIYDSDDVVLAGGHDQETDIPTDATWEFEIQWDARDRVDRVDDHEVFAFGNT
ncbi:MAG: FxLYD domain-containing protein [Halopenitus sp.]